LQLPDIRGEDLLPLIAVRNYERRRTFGLRRLQRADRQEAQSSSLCGLNYGLYAGSIS
jgi:hypothetical protein